MAFEGVSSGDSECDQFSISMIYSGCKDVHFIIVLETKFYVLFNICFIGKYKLINILMGKDYR